MKPRSSIMKFVQMRSASNLTYNCSPPQCHSHPSSVKLVQTFNP